MHKNIPTKYEKRQTIGYMMIYVPFDHRKKYIPKFPERATKNLVCMDGKKWICMFSQILIKKC